MQGRKVFYVAEPSERHLALFQEYSSDRTRSERLFADELGRDACLRVVIEAGETLLIPAGWIHAVWTPVDTLVFGGNILHSLHIPLQLRSDWGAPIRAP